jgi:hypothetical protein
MHVNQDCQMVYIFSAPPQLIDRQLIDRQLIDRQLIDRQLIDRQLIDRQLIDRQLIDPNNWSIFYNIDLFICRIPAIARISGPISNFFSIQIFVQFKFLFNSIQIFVQAIYLSTLSTKLSTK